MTSDAARAAMARLGILPLEDTMFGDPDAATENAGRTYEHNDNTRELLCPQFSDISVAHSVRMLLRDDWHHEAKVQMARDRILCLVAEKQALQRENDEIRALNASLTEKNAKAMGKLIATESIAAELYLGLVRLDERGPTDASWSIVKSTMVKMQKLLPQWRAERGEAV